MLLWNNKFASSSAHIIGTIHPLIKVHEASVRYLGVLQMIRQLYTDLPISRASNPHPFTVLVVRTYLNSVISLANTCKTWAPASKNCAYCLRVYGVVLLVHYAGINLVRVERFELPTLCSQSRCANQTALHTEKTWCPMTESNCRNLITKQV